jgi:hypothetical protein
VRIGVDFDRVLFDTDSFNEYLKEEVEELIHVETRPYNEHGVYSPEMHADLCGIDPEKIYEALTNLDQFVYDDMDVLFDSEHEIIVVTRGEIEFQKAKVEATEIAEKAEDVVIVEKGSKDVKEIDFLIDDQKREIEEAWLPGFEFDRERHSLEDALKEVDKHAA